jgi:AcrR family transcriptional regulator
VHPPSAEIDRRTSGPTAQAIAAHAATLFAERGYDATPVRAIADAAGVTCPTLYYHFGNKEGLAQALLLQPLESLHHSILALIAQRLDPVDRLKRVVAAHLEFIQHDPTRGRFLLAVMFGPLGSGVVVQVRTAIDRVIAADREALHALVDAGILAPEHLDDLLLCLRGQYVIRSADFLFRDQPLDPDQAGRFVDQTLYGFATTPVRSPDSP